METPQAFCATSYDLKRVMQLTYGDKYYLQATMNDFHDMLDAQGLHGERRQTRHTIVQPNSKELLEISKRVLESGELDIAEKFLGKAIRKEKFEDASKERNPEPYYFLAEVLKKKASRENVALPQRQKLLLQAASLYNFVRNCLNKSTVESEFATVYGKFIPERIMDVQVSLILAAEGDHLRSRFNFESKKTTMEQLREECKRKFEMINAKNDVQAGGEEDQKKIFVKQAADVRDLYRKIASRIKQLLTEIIQECLEVLGEPPCEYEVILLGSLAREEMTPYSDLEWAILTSSEDEKSKIFFRNLTNLVHLQIINLGETILPCMDIDVLRGDWFYDDVTPRGLSFDGLLPQASKTPLGNTEHFELIHSPITMANFQSNYWHNKDPRLGEILLTVAPLDEGKHNLLEEYNTELEKILHEPCDLENCTHNAFCTSPTRGACRGLSILKEDISKYAPQTLDIFGDYDGKLYDVKKEIYRLIDRMVAGLSKVFCGKGNGSFEILDKLCERNVINLSARDNLASAVAIALKFRLSTYLWAEKQEEEIKANSRKASVGNNVSPVYQIPREKELFHFFYVHTPLYELLCRFCADNKNHSDVLAREMFFNFSDAIKGHMHCRLLNYKAASDCYKRALEADPGNTGVQKRLKEIESMFGKNDNTGKPEMDKLTKKCFLSWSSTPDGNKTLGQLISLIKKEGIRNVRAIILLNGLGELLIREQRTGEAYQCLQRAFIMGQTLFGDNPNSHAVVTLNLLGNVCYNLSLFDESKFCRERSLKLLPSSDSEENFEILRGHIYSRLAISYAFTGNYDKAISHIQKALDLNKASAARFSLESECTLLCQMALIWHWAGKNEKAWQCALNANECLTNAVSAEATKVMIYYVSFAYWVVGKTEEAKLLLQQGIETQVESKDKIFFLNFLGELCSEQGLMEEAEQHYKTVLKILRIENDRKHDIVSALLDLSKLLVVNMKSSEAVSYLKEAAKYVSNMTDSDMKLEFSKKIAERWEDLEDDYQAQMWFNEALKVCKTSVIIPNVARENEFDLHVKLGDLVGKVSSKSSLSPEKSTIFVINEQAKNNQRKHYDQAYHLLQPHLGTDKLSLVLLTDLAKRYAFIDSPKSEELFLEVMTIIEKHYGPESINELAASTLIKLAWVGKEQNKDMKALDFLDRSLKMEFQMHASDPFHEHISENISFLAILSVYLESPGPQYEQLQTAKKQVLAFFESDNLDEGSINSLRKADCLMSLAYLCVCSEDYEKAEKLNHIAISIFAKSKENKSRQDEPLDITVCHLTDMILKYVKSREAKNMTVTRRQVLDFNCTIDCLIPRNAISRLVKGILCRYCISNGDLPLKNESCKFLSQARKRLRLDNLSENISSHDLQNFSHSTDINVEKIKLRNNGSEEVSQVHNNVTNRESEDGSTSSSSTLSHGRSSNETDENQDHVTDSQRLDAKVSLESDYHNACLVAESILCDSNHRYLQHVHKSGEYSFFSSCVKSSCVQSFIIEAESARDNENLFQMMVFLDLAFRRAEDPESKTKIFKLIGECHLYLQNNRTAAISFGKAVDFYRSAGPPLKLEDKAAYAESLVGLAQSRMLCNDMKSALFALEEGVELVSSVDLRQTTSGLLAKLLYLAVKCTLQLSTSSTSPETFNRCLERCKKAIDLIRTSDLNELCESEEPELLFEISLLKATTSFQISQQITELRKVKMFFETTADRLETLDIRDDDIIKYKRSLFSCLGRVLVMMGETENATVPLRKSLRIFLAPAFMGMNLPWDEIITLLDAITETWAVTTQQASVSPFHVTLELCKNEFLNQNDHPFLLMNFFRNLGNHYVEAGRTEEATLAYEAGLAVVEHMIVEPIDQINGRGEMLIHLANVHRLQAIGNIGKGAEEERRLAEEYFKSKNGNGTEKSSVHKNIMYANFLCDEGRFEDAIVLIKQVEEVSITQWTVMCSYSQRVLYGSALEKYIESHGELLTNMGILACTTLVRAYIGLGENKKAVLEDIRMRLYAKDLPTSFICTIGPDLSIHKKYFPAPVEKPGKLAFKHAELLESGIQLRYSYKSAEEDEVTKVGDGGTLSFTNEEELLNKLSNLRLSGNALVFLGVGNKSYSYYSRFLEMLQQREGILDKPFEDQMAILSQYTFPGPFYVCQSLGSMLASRGKLDEAILCYEHCLRRGPAYGIDQNFMATLSELYQTKALIEDNHDAETYTLYMGLARGCFHELLNKNKKMTPFVESNFASFLFRTECLDEAISHFKQVLASETTDEITLSKVDIPLFGVHIAREIQARVEVYLPLKVHVYHQMVRAYFKSGKDEETRESVLQMEEYVKNFATSPRYSTIRSMLGYTYKETGNERKAMEILLTVLETEPDNMPVKLALEECRTQQTTSNSD